MTSNEVQNLGTGLAALMSMDQLQAAVILYNSLAVLTTQQNTISISHLRQAFFNHMKACLRMPRGGASAGGSHKGFEMELVSSMGISQLMHGWPNHEAPSEHRQSWELRTFEELATHLALESQGWGALQGRPMAIPPGKEKHEGVLLIGPPFTVSWGLRPDGTTWVCARFPMALWTEEDAIILPPDDSNGVPFYIDPPGQPGFIRDQFKMCGRQVARELMTLGFPMSRSVISHLGPDYQSDSEVSIGSPRPRSEYLDSSDEEGAHQPWYQPRAATRGDHLMPSV